MPRIDTWLECDLQHPVQVKVLNGYVFSQDNMANKIGVIVTDNGEPVTLTGTVYGYIIRSDNHTIEVAGSIENTNRAYFIMPQEGYLVGNVSIVIKVINASQITTLAACTSYVYESRTGQEYVPTGTPIPDLSTLQEAINNANTAASAANTAATNANAIAQTVVAAEFSSSNAYAVGQYVMKSGTLYRFTSAHTAGNAWSSSEVTAVKLANDTSDLKSALDVTNKDLSEITSYLEPVVLELGSINTTTGAYVDSNDGTRFRTNMLIPCKNSTKYIITVKNSTGNSMSGMLCYYRSDKTYIDSYSMTLSGTETVLEKTTHANAAYVAVRLNGTGMTPSNVSFSAYTTYSQKYNTLINYGNIETSGLDLNTGNFVRAGMWALADMTKKPTNYPSSVTGRVISFASNTDSSFATVQIVVDSDNAIYERYSSANGTWSDWKTIASKASVDSIESNAVISKGNISSAGLDLNLGDFIHPGIWALASMSNVPYNYPSSVTGRVICFASSSSSSFATTQVVVDSNNDIFIRYSSANGVWNDWNCISAYNPQSFKCMFTNPQPFVNDYDINRISGSTPNKVATLYGLYDAVTETGVTITKDTLGKDASDTFNIYNYKVSLNTGSKPVVLIICGEHGDELTSAYIGYYLYKEIVQGVLKKYLRFVDFWVVPLMNPYGYENRTRNNANDVNLNRDFPANWEYSESSHNKTGNYSLSQPESNLIYNLVKANKDKILFICNKHDTGGIAKKIATDQEDIVAYVSTILEGDKTVNNGVTTWENQQVRETDPWIISDCTVDISQKTLIASRTVNTGGSMDMFFNSIGIHGSLLEVAGASYYTADGYPYYPTDQYHYKDLARLGLDFFVNWVAQSIENNDILLKNNKTLVNCRYYTRKYNSETESWDVVEQWWNGSALVDIE